MTVRLARFAAETPNEKIPIECSP